MVVIILSVSKGILLLAGMKVNWGELRRRYKNFITDQDMLHNKYILKLSYGVHDKT
jgi:hypothetical protein